MKIEVGKFYKTRHGSKVRVYTNDACGDYCVHGAILIKGEVGGEYWRVECWTADGVYRKYNTSDLDLIAEWTEPLDFDPSCLPAWANWIVMIENGSWFWFQSQPDMYTEGYWVGGSIDTKGYIPQQY